MLKAARRKIREIEAEYARRKADRGMKYSFNAFSEEIQQAENNEITNITISIEDFSEALANITPSVSEQELLKYEELRKKF